MPNIHQVRRVLLSAPAVSAAAPPTFTFVSTVIPTGSGTATISTASADIGTASASRRVYVILAGGLGGGGRTIVNGSSTINGVTVDFSGNSATLSDNDSFWWASAVVPTGTTGVTVSLGFGGTFFGGPVMGIYTVDDGTLLSKTPTLGSTDVSVAALTGSAAVATLASGSIISSIYTSSGTGAETISASDAGLSTDAANINNSAGFGHANATPASASSNVTWTWTTSSKAGICNFAFR